MIRIALTLIQMITSLILGNKKHYLNTPTEIISWIKIDRILKLGHFFPSVILAIILAVKILPLVSTWYSNELEKNGIIIPVTLLILLIPILILNGIIIEKILMTNNVVYKDFVENGRTKA